MNETPAIVKEMDYHNAEVIRAVLLSGNHEDVERMRAARSWTRDQVDVFAHYIRLHFTVHEQMKKDVERRCAGRPLADPYEMRLGAYREEIEPQMREAIELAQEKGYGTFSCGFYGRDAQDISFEGGALKGFNFHEQFLEDFKARGVDVQVTDGRILLEFSRKFTLDELRGMWKAVVEQLLDLHRAPAQSSTRMAMRFRQEQHRLMHEAKYGRPQMHSFDD